MTELDIAVLNFKAALTKKSLVVGVSTSKVFDFMYESKQKQIKNLEFSWRTFKKRS